MVLLKSLKTFPPMERQSNRRQQLPVIWALHIKTLLQTRAYIRCRGTGCWGSGSCFSGRSWGCLHKGKECLGTHSNHPEIGAALFWGCSLSSHGKYFGSQIWNKASPKDESKFVFQGSPASRRLATILIQHPSFLQWGEDLYVPTKPCLLFLGLWDSWDVKGSQYGVTHRSLVLSTERSPLIEHSAGTPGCCPHRTSSWTLAGSSAGLAPESSRQWRLWLGEK